MLSPFVSWILSSSSSSSSSDEEHSLDINTDESDHENNNIANEDNNHNDNIVVDHDQNDDHCLSSCDVDDDDDAIPVALATPNASTVVGASTTTATTIVTRPKRQRSERITSYSDFGKQYQRLWTKHDEIELLKGYLDYIKHHRKGTTTLQNDVALLSDHVRPKLNVDFNKNQLVEKLHRLKRKHKVYIDKVNNSTLGSRTFKNLQDKVIFEISHKIWGNDKDQDGKFDSNGSSPVTESRDLGNVNVKVKNEQVENNCDEIIDNKLPKRLRLCNECNNGDNAISIQGLIEETMRSCFSPLLKEELDTSQERSLEGLEVKPLPLCCGQLMEQKILELEVYLNRLELLQGKIKARLEELRSG